MRFVNSLNTIAIMIIIVALISLRYMDISHSFYTYVKFLSLTMVILSSAFCIYFSKSKLLVLQIIPLFFILYMFYPSYLYLDGGNYSFWYIYPLSISFSFLFISILQERGIHSYYGISKLFIVLFILTISYYFLHTFSLELRNALDLKILSFELFDFIKVNDFTLLIILISLFFISFISFVFFKGDSEKVPFWSFVYLIIPALFFQEKIYFLVFCVLSSILIIIAILKDTYKMAYLDTLTAIPSRRALEEDFLKLGSKYTVAMVDIDFFKKFNDTHGHDVGDEVLKLVAAQLREVKGRGKAYRYGGEEFTIVFPNKTVDDAYMYLEELRENIAKRGFVLRDKNRPKETPKTKAKQSTKQKNLKLTVSIGLAHATKEQRNPHDVIKKADTALYKAKENGRNCTQKA